MTRPHGVAVDGKGKLYVADTENNRVQVFSGPELAFERVVGRGEGGGYGQMRDPMGVAVDSGGKLYVADPGNNRVQVFSGNELTFERVVGLGYGDGEGQMKYPNSVAVDGEGKLYVADTGNNRVQVFSLNKEKGDFDFENTVKLGEGRGDGLKFPGGVAVDWSRAVIVSDTYNNRAQVLDK
jgi:DNA-binding beta-propeller fold protein YncE